MSKFQTISFRILVLSFGILIAGCNVRTETSTVINAPSISAERIIPQAEAVEPKIDRTNPTWLADYCFQILEQTAIIPTSFERARGPFITMNPLHLSKDLSSAKQVTTCTKDFYIWPVAKQAMADLEINYAYNASTWEKFHQAVTASVSAELIEDGWQKSENKIDSKTAPYASYTRTNSYEEIDEYLDLYFTKDEEVVFEVAVSIQ